MPKERTIQVYQLIDPRNGQVFYVGQAADAEKRLRGHIKDAIDTEKRLRIKEILSSGKQPQMVVIASIPESVAGDYEKLLIKITRGLTNKQHNAEQCGGELYSNGKKVPDRGEDIGVLCDAIANHYVINLEDKTKHVTTKDLYQNLKRYCNGKNERINRVLIGEALRLMGLEKTRRRVNGKPQYMYEGIAPRDPFA